MPSTMLLAAAFSVFAALSSAQSATVSRVGGVAPIVTSNPLGARYIALFPVTTNSPVNGSVAAESIMNGTGIRFSVQLSGLPENVGAFPYHLHQMPVATDGNCSSTLAHLDPFNRGETPACDASEPQTCQVGDLSGKWGPAASSTFSATFIDLYVSLLPGNAAFFGNRSIVIHYANLTRIACANFVVENAGTTPASVAPNNGTTKNSTSTVSGVAGGGGVVIATTVITTSATHSSLVSTINMIITKSGTAGPAASGTGSASPTVAMATTAAAGSLKGAGYIGVPAGLSFFLGLIAALF